MSRTALYRLFGHDGTLLYVGIASNPRLRWKQHARAATWWDQVDPGRTRVEWYPSRASARSAETVAIMSEVPSYNVAGSPNRTHPKRPTLTELHGLPVVGIKDLRGKLGEHVDATYYRDHTVIVSKNGGARAALVSPWMYRLLVDSGIAPPLDTLR